MSIKKIKYTESDELPNEWTLGETDFREVNLIVGKNSTGKSRLLNLISGYANLINGKQNTPYTNATYDGEILVGEDEYRYVIEFKNNCVKSEYLTVNGVEKLSRNSKGEGKIFYEAENRNISFKLEVSSIAVQQYRDTLQHPYLISLNKWAKSVVIYQFGSEFGRNSAITLKDATQPIEDQEKQQEDDPANVMRTYVIAYEKFGDDFDHAILNDMREIGYKLTDVGVGNLPIPGSNPLGLELVGLFTTEEDLQFRNYQMGMSVGMFRALALIINLNWSIFSNRSGTLLLDDIGEGLDFERSRSLIELLIHRIEGTSMQLLMTSNDRFVMNSVPLKYWTILKRTGRDVRSYSERNSIKHFEEFKYMGLNNFDFFTADVFD
ncbi:AAA family ATPase [Undibacterium sp. Ji83W]|uniref:AAA family ATPase n=1 Tax=Undibacterium sp. Ji83W TaxID=3413043 RepID=UPI003BF32745